MQLHDVPLRDGICIFYLVLRALDTIEDDMTLSNDFKLRELPQFHTHLRDETWVMHGVGKGCEAKLLEDYPRVTREFAKLKPCYQKVIEDICAAMAQGMCEFLSRPIVTVADYDQYCHYVAGLVGHGLTRLFAQCGFEDPHLADDLSIANEMGLFLQKTNIIRDYYEDMREDPPRVF
uniref:Squalene synthase n=1 Tax=Lygus hesperus TaxID=30085 RepID=A0A0A9YPI7_LYGHE